MDEVVEATVVSFNRDLCPYFSNDTSGKITRPNEFGYLQKWLEYTQ